MDNWRTAFSDFFTNIVLTKCYKDTFLLTNSECQKSRNFLYSIREHIDRNFIKEDSDDTDSSEDTLVKGHIIHETDEDDKELDQGDIAGDSEIQEIHASIDQKPTFTMHQKDGIWRPSVKVFSVNKRTGEKKIMMLHLMDEEGNDGSEPIGEKQEKKLLSKIRDLQTKYPNLVIHTY